MIWSIITSNAVCIIRMSGSQGMMASGWHYAFKFRSVEIHLYSGLLRCIQIQGCRGYWYGLERLWEKIMKKALHITVTIITMLIASRFFVRIVDATVQIGEDLGVLIVLLVVINAAIGGMSYLVYRRHARRQKVDGMMYWQTGARQSQGCIKYDIFMMSQYIVTDRELWRWLDGKITIKKNSPGNPWPWYRSG